MKYRIEQASWLRPPKKWVLIKRRDNTRLGWDAVASYETKQEALSALKQHKAAESK